MESTQQELQTQEENHCSRLHVLINVTQYFRAIVLIAAVIYIFIIPAVGIMVNLRDPGLVDGSMSRFLYDWHRDLSPKYETWAKQRLVSDKAAQLSVDNIPGTEWPLFGSVFYLWATDALQNAWQQDPTLFDTAPAVYAKGAIEASTALVTDPAHATWVIDHWGDDYLEKENLFYRMLLMHAMITCQRLTGDTQYEAALTAQVNAFAEELDASPYGLLDDYPSQCYPVDIMPAYVAIQRADTLLGLDHSEMLERGIRTFTGDRVDANTGLTAYNVDADSGDAMGPARGVGMSFMLAWAPEIWPEYSQQWYPQYEQYFWQEGCLFSGFREFSKASSDGNSDWMFEVDAGPIVDGYGVAASAFGLAAARANGRMDHAYPLSALALTGAWRLPNGTMPLPRMLSSLADAPYLGQAAILFSMTRQPTGPVTQPTGKKMPALVWLVVGFALLIGFAQIIVSSREIRRLWTGTDPYIIPWPGFQLAVRGVLLLTALVLFFINSILLAQLTVFFAVILSYYKIKKQKSKSITCSK